MRTEIDGCGRTYGGRGDAAVDVYRGSSKKLNENVGNPLNTLVEPTKREKCALDGSSWGFFLVFDSSFILFSR